MLLILRNKIIYISVLSTLKVKSFIWPWWNLLPSDCVCVWKKKNLALLQLEDKWSIESQPLGCFIVMFDVDRPDMFKPDKAFQKLNQDTKNTLIIKPKKIKLHPHINQMDNATITGTITENVTFQEKSTNFGKIKNSRVRYFGVLFYSICS